MVHTTRREKQITPKILVRTEHTPEVTEKAKRLKDTRSKRAYGDG